MARTVFSEYGYHVAKVETDTMFFERAGTKGEMVKSATVSGVHLCCNDCVEAVEKALKSVEGIEEHTAKSKAETFEITGEFSPSEVLRYLRRTGLNGTIE